MSSEHEKVVPIPTDWRTQVVAVQQAGDKDRIQSTTESDTDWRHTFPNAWDYQRPEAMAKALSTDGITGRHVTDMVPQCDAYEFFFNFDERKVLGKIGLRPNGILIIIFSSHIPRKGDKL